MMAQVTPMISQLDRRYKTLQSQRSNWERHWQELADFMLPRKADITKHRTQGDKRTELIFDATAIHAVELLASSLHGMLTGPSTPWFSLMYRAADLQRDDAANEWLETCSDQMYKAFNRSNFQQEIHELYYDLVVFGTGAFYVEASDSGDLRFSCRHIAEICISEDAQGRVDTVYRKFKMTARALAMRFGEQNMPSVIQRDLKGDPYKEHEIVHAVFPRGESGAKTAKNKPVASIYYHADTRMLLSEGGFDEFPFMVPRFVKDSVSTYGRSPAMTALPDVKMVNKMSEITIRAAQKQIDPPLMVPDDGFLLPVRTTPGALNFYRSGTRDRLEPMNIGANNPLGLNMEEQRRGAIRQAFYVDQLLLGQGPTMTATEVLQRNEEKMRLLGPVLGRLQAELLQPVIERAFAIMLRNGKLPQPPESMQGMDINIEYISPLAKAQKLTDLQSVMRGLEVLLQVGQVAPVQDYIDSDKLIKYLVDTTGIPASVIRSDEEVAKLRRQAEQQQSQQADQQQQMEMAQQAQMVAPLVKAVS
tara:strand:- start:923 stop:2518 length:1596 start_codon:yes stop_codon:yes gene_type:complete